MLPQANSNQYMLLVDPDLNIISADEKFWRFIDSLPQALDLVNIGSMCPDLSQGLRLKKALEALSVSVLPMLLEIPLSDQLCPEVRNLTLLLSLFEVRNQEQGLGYSFCQAQSFSSLKNDHLRCTIESCSFGGKDFLKIMCSLERDSNRSEEPRIVDRLIELSEAGENTGRLD